MPAIYHSIPNLPPEISLNLWEFLEEISFFEEKTSEPLKSSLNFRRMIAQKRKESLACRFLLESSLESIQPLLQLPSGKPYFETGPYFSLSHTKRFAASAISVPFEIGIDIEENSRAVSKIAARFLSERELQFLNSEEMHRLGWCMKEAMYKAFGQSGLDFRTEVQIIEDDEFYAGRIKNKEKEIPFSLFWSIEEQFTICVAVPNLPGF